MKDYEKILKWGRIKPYFDSTYNFNSIDIETINNKLFLIGFYDTGYKDLSFKKEPAYYPYFSDFYDRFNEILISSLENHKDILTWSRYDNTFLIKLLLSRINPKERNHILLKIGKITPIFTYTFRDIDITLVNVIKDSFIFRIWGKTVTIYNLKNLFDTDLLHTAENYGLTYYSKLGEEYHLIDKKRFYTDLEYKRIVLLSNELDAKVLIDIAWNMLNTFKDITGHLPKSIYTNGSLARSYLLANIDKIGSKNLNFNMIFAGVPKRKQLLEYAMKTYHGGKIESYVLGYIKKAKIIDITSAYPFALSNLPLIKPEIIYSKDINLINNYFYVFINCKIEIKSKSLIHPCIVENPINQSNISPYGFFEATITKIEYDYLLKHGANVEVIDFYAVESDNNIYPYKELINEMFDKRMASTKTNISLSLMYKKILNSLYGITYELTDIYSECDNGNIIWQGYRAGDFFNPVIASYITASTRSYLSDVSNNIIENGGSVFLNMTDSIIYDGNVTLDVISEKKTLGKFDKQQDLEDIIILGAGRYEYKNVLHQNYTIKNRGFSVNIKDEAFYKNLDLSSNVKIDHRTFVTTFKATTKKYSYDELGFLIDDTYNINPFNIGGKRIINNDNINLNKEYTTTEPVYLERSIKIERKIN